VQYFRAVLALAGGAPDRLKPGARVRAEIVVADLETALTVPRQAVGSADGVSVVWRRVGTGFEATPVELGPSAGGRGVVLEGLAAGDEIALRDPEQTPAAGNGETSTAPGLGGRE
jgi:cobalt-zinc-cadmium efflux system membrane fusion protein